LRAVPGEEVSPIEKLHAEQRAIVFYALTRRRNVFDEERGTPEHVAYVDTAALFDLEYLIQPEAAVAHRFRQRAVFR
jgi:hypothetical protein